MMEERYHATTQNRLYPDMSNVNKNITVEAKLISRPMYNLDSLVDIIHMLVSAVCLNSQFSSHHTDIQQTPTYGLHLQDSPDLYTATKQTTSTSCNYYS